MEKKELYVDISGGQQFVSIGDALAAARQLDAARQSDAASQGAARSAEMEVIIHIAPGIYKERLEIKQDHVSFIGTDAERTKITYSDGALDLMPEGDKRGTFRTPSVFIDADYFYARNISFCNEAGQGNKVGQALAVYADGDHLIFENCRFDGHQDTLFTAPLPKKEKQAGGDRKSVV